MYSGIAGALSNSTVNLMDRRLFLARLAALGGAAVSVPGLNVFAAAEAPRNTAAQVPGGRGKVQQVRGEIREYKDPKTGARVRRLTGDGSSNVHPYFTSWAFVGDDADNTVFVSNRSGAFLSSDDKEGGKYLGLMTHANGRVQIRRLAWHGS